MQKKLGSMPSCLQPLNGKAMLDHIISRYDGRVDHVYVVGYENAHQIENHIKNRNDISLLILDSLGDLGHTVNYGIKKIREAEGDSTQIIINYADTIIENVSTENDSIYYYNMYPEQGWTFFTFEEGITSIFDKKINGMDFNRTYPVFTGCYFIRDLRLFDECLKEPHLEGVDTFYSAIVKYSFKKSIKYIKAEGWIDSGHSMNYSEAKRIVSQRSFNQINIDSKRGTIEKKSKNKNKLIDEINWYLKIPPELKYLCPNIYDYSTNSNGPYICMEYYSYPTLHELLIFGNLDKYSWERVFKSILFRIEDMSRFQPGTGRYLKDSLYEMYVEKTISRMKSIEAIPELKRFYNNPFEINGEKYLPITKYMSLIKEVVPKRLVTNDISFHVIHGDLAFSNILFDLENNIMRLLDPRGQFGAYGIYGDERYELAKIMHCTEGFYDYIIEDMFTISIEGSNIEYSINHNGDADKIFKSVFCDRISDVDNLRLIESLLFLSMIPLHNENSNRQIVMLARGLELLRKSGV